MININNNISRFITCYNTNCKYYWESMCSVNVDCDMVYIDKEGKCTNFKQGESEWYKLAEEGEGINE